MPPQHFYGSAFRHTHNARSSSHINHITPFVGSRLIHIGPKAHYNYLHTPKRANRSAIRKIHIFVHRYTTMQRWIKIQSDLRFAVGRRGIRTKDSHCLFLDDRWSDHLPDSDPLHFTHTTFRAAPPLCGDCVERWMFICYIYMVLYTGPSSTTKTISKLYKGENERFFVGHIREMNRPWNRIESNSDGPPRLRLLGKILREQGLVLKNVWNSNMSINK